MANDNIAELLTKVNTEFKSAINDDEIYTIIEQIASGLSVALKPAAVALGNLSANEVAVFYVAMGYCAVQKEINILDINEISDHIGFSDLPEAVALVYTKGIESGLMTDKARTAASTYNGTYSSRALADFSNQELVNHVRSDIKAIAGKVDSETAEAAADQWLKNIKAYHETEGQDALYLYNEYVRFVKPILKTVYASSYQLIKPYGIVKPNMEKVDSEAITQIVPKEGTKVGQYSYTKSYSTAMRRMSNVINEDILPNDKFVVDTDSEIFSPSKVFSQPNGVLTYFTKPHAKLLFGYNLVSTNKDNLGTKKYSTWPQVEKDLDKVLPYLFMTVIKYVFETNETAKSFYDINSTDNMADAVHENIEKAMLVEDEMKGYFKRFAQSLIVTAAVVEYSGSKDSPAKFVLRVVAPTGNYSNKQLVEKVTTAAGTVINQEGGEEKILDTEKLTKGDTYDLDVYQFEHTYNQKVANTTPIFAAKALSYLNRLEPQPGEPVVSWRNMLVGMRTDGQIEVGQNNATYSSNIIHWLQAGSRSGKGVMSYNIILSANSDNKLFFFNDRKPDTSKVLIEQAGGKDSKGRPQMAVVNGGQRNALAQNGSEDWMVEWQRKSVEHNRPRWFKFKNDNQQADFIYLRQYLIVMSIVSAIANKGISNMNTELGLDKDYVTGIFSVLDEFTNFSAGMAKTLHPFATASFLSKIPNENAIRALKNPKGAAFKKFNDFKPKKGEEDADPAAERNGFYAEMFMDKVYRYDILQALIRTRETVIEANNAGLANNTDLIDILVIGQGIKSYYSKDAIGFDIEKGGPGFNKDKSKGLADASTRDIITDTLKSITLQDFILGWPHGKPEADFLGVEGNGPGSKLSAYINGNYRGFAYSTADNLNNPENAFVFKPFLLLNEGTELPELKNPNSTVKELSDAAAKHNNSKGGYLAFLATQVEKTDGTTWQTVRNEIKEDLQLDERGSKESLAGVIPYANEIGFDSDKYARTLNFMQAILDKIGYDGDYLDFVTDTRPEWLIGPGDIETAIFGTVEDFRNRPSIEGVRTYTNSQLYDNEQIDKTLLGMDPEAMNDDYEDTSDYDSSVEMVPGMGLDQVDEDTEDEDFEPETEEQNLEDVESVDTDEDLDDIEDQPTDEHDLFEDNVVEEPEETEKPEETEEPEEFEETPSDANKFEDGHKKQKGLTPEELTAAITALSTQLATGAITQKQFTDSVAALTKQVATPQDKHEVKESASDAIEKHEYETSVRDLLDKSYKAGKHDGEQGNLIFLSQESKDMLEEARALHGDIDTYTSYKEGYVDGHATLLGEKRDVFMDKVNSHLPGASETRELLGLQEEVQKPFITRLLNSDRPVRYGIETMKQGLVSIHKDLESVYGQDKLDTVNELTNNAYTPEVAKGYSNPNVYINGDKVGKVNNLSNTIDSKYFDTGDVDMDLMSYMQDITAKIVNKIGGYKQIKRIHIVSTGRMIINNSYGVNFAIPVDEFNKLPILIQKAINEKAWGQLFVWATLQQLPNLTSVAFDSYDFVLDYVRPAIDPADAQFDQKNIFRFAPQILSITIGTDTVNIDESGAIQENNVSRYKKSLRDNRQKFMAALIATPIDDSNFTSRTSRKKAQQQARKETNQRRAAAALTGTNNITKTGTQWSGQSFKNNIKRPGFGKLLAVPAGALFLASGTGYLVSKAAKNHSHNPKLNQ